MKRLHYIYVFLSVLLPVTFTACIKDDLSGCISDTRIYFDYERNLSSKKDGGINPDDITRINLFVFDDRGLFVNEYIDEAPHMSEEYFMTVNGLKKGYYRFVAWGNLGEHYALSSALVPGETTFEDLRVALINIKDNKVEYRLQPLFYATHKGSRSIEIMEVSAQHIRLNLIEDTYKINLTVSGMDPASVADYDYLAEITDNNGAYGLDNDFAPFQEFKYTQPCTVEAVEQGGDLKSSLIVLRLTENRTPVLRLINKQNNTVIVEDSLVKLIMDANEAGATIDFNKTHEFDIRYELSQSSSIGIIIYINGWKLIKQPDVLD
ncbi:MAG: FimB/Mfa2 family fimbrial subunit [Tannerellaceae bacterium]|jgi:hypothetical protein|nr:FimB/Mfa2 family fimbrial subunit [Tannerellaceae bacterium]